MIKKTILNLLALLVITSCNNFLSDDSSSSGEKRVSIVTNPLEAIAEVENVYIKVSGPDMDTLEVNTTESLYYMTIPTGSSRTIEVLLRLLDSREFYGSITQDINSDTDRVEVIVGDITYGDITLTMENASITSSDLGLGNDIYAYYGDDIEVSIVRTQPNGVPTWFLNNTRLNDIYTDSITIPGGDLLIGEHKVSCRFLSGTTYLTDSVKIIVEPPVTNPISGSIIDLFEHSPGNYTLIWSQSSDLDTPESDLRYKVVLDGDSSKLTIATDADSANRKILAGWGTIGAAYYSVDATNNVTLLFGDSFTGINYVTVLVMDGFGNISVYDFASADFGV